MKWSGVIIAAALALAAAWYLGASNTRNSQQADQQSRQYADDAYQRIFDTCLHRSLPAFVDCAGQIVKSSEEAKTAQQDLAAQRGMELWALGMFGAAVASVVATVFGIVLVWLNLQEARAVTAQAREANVAAARGVELAHQAMRTELAAYLEVRKVEFSETIGDLGDINVSVENIGKTPANNIYVSVDCRTPNEAFAMNDTENAHKFSAAMEIGSISAGELESAGLPIMLPSKVDLREVMRFIIIDITVHFRDIFVGSPTRKIEWRFCASFDSSKNEWVVIRRSVFTVTQ